MGETTASERARARWVLRQQRQGPRVHKFTPDEELFVPKIAKLLDTTEDQVKRKWGYGDILPEWEKLKGILLKIGGEIVHQPSLWAVSFYPFIPALVKAGYLMKGPVKLKKMRARRCYANVARLWREGKIEGIGYGYARNDDFGHWAEHSWGLTKEGILETTVPRDGYFGLRFEGEHAYTLCDLHDASTCWQIMG